MEQENEMLNPPREGESHVSFLKPSKISWAARGGLRSHAPWETQDHPQQTKEKQVLGAISSLKCRRCLSLETEALDSLELFGFLSSARWLMRKPGSQAGKKQARSPPELDISSWTCSFQWILQKDKTCHKKKNLRSFTESERIAPFEPTKKTTKKTPKNKNQKQNTFLGIGCYKCFSWAAVPSHGCSPHWGIHIFSLTKHEANQSLEPLFLLGYGIKTTSNH